MREVKFFNFIRFSSINIILLVDIWSIGCCFGELIRKTIIFPGIDHADQYTKIVSLLGTPSSAFLERLQPGVRTYLQEKHPHVNGYSFEELFPDSVFPEEQDNSEWARKFFKIEVFLLVNQRGFSF